jgi:PAS domain S-box-containing protein
MKDRIATDATPQVRDISDTNRDLLEKALHMRCLSYVSNVKSLLLTETIFEIDQSKKHVQKINNLLLEQRQTIHQQKEELERKNRELLEMKNQLEDLVRQRTVELRNTNKELQKEIQDRHQIELALRDSENKFRSLLQSAPDAIVITDENGIIDLVNDQTEKIFGYSRQELVGQPVELLIPTHLRSSHQTHRQRYLAMPYCRFMGDGLELHGQTKNGETIPVEVALSPLQTQKGMLVTASIRDISKRKQVEAELSTYREHLEELVAERTAALSTVNKELEEFSYSVSHDLRAPLRSVDGFSLALMEDFSADLPDEAKSYLHRIRAAAQRMGHLIDEVLELARVSRCDLSKKKVDLTRLANDIIADLQINHPERKAEITVSDHLHARADENLVRVILENLLDNAWKFTSREANTRITVGQLPRAKQKTFYVKDNGVGLDMKYSKKLFSPFQRLHSHKDFPGTGVGLATVYRILQRHNGRIWVDSSPDEGATFYFTLGD